MSLEKCSENGAQRRIVSMELFWCISRNCSAVRRTQPEQPTINWANMNYPPFLRIVHYDPSELPSPVARIARFINAVFLITCAVCYYFFYLWHLPHRHAFLGGSTVSFLPYVLRHFFSQIFPFPLFSESFRAAVLAGSALSTAHSIFASSFLSLGIFQIDGMSQFALRFVFYEGYRGLALSNSFTLSKFMLLQGGFVRSLFYSLISILSVRPRDSFCSRSCWGVQRLYVFYNDE